MNISREIVKLRRLDRAGYIVTLGELEQVESVLRSALDALQKRDCRQAIVALESLVEKGNDVSNKESQAWKPLLALWITAAVIAAMLYARDHWGIAGAVVVAVVALVLIVATVWAVRRWQ